ncbi:MAG: metallophosphoesterase [Halobacteriaceae archaeon]
MNIGIISDIHANKIALDAVFDHMPADLDHILCAGDIVGYNPWPSECVKVIRDKNIPTVMGNHDRMVISNRNFRGNPMARAGIDHAREELSTEQQDWLESLPNERTEMDGQVKIVHGHPDDPNYYTYPEEFSPDLLANERVLIMGHTHVQHHEKYDNGIVMNPGSVGQPRDHNPDAAYAVLDLNAMTVQEHRVSYDIQAVQDAIADHDLPHRTGERLTQGR